MSSQLIRLGFHLTFYLFLAACTNFGFYLNKIQSQVRNEYVVLDESISQYPSPIPIDISRDFDDHQTQIPSKVQEFKKEIRNRLKFKYRLLAACMPNPDAAVADVSLEKYLPKEPNVRQNLLFLTFRVFRI